MMPYLVIIIGIAALLFGKRLAVLGAAVGALLGLVALSLFQLSDNIWIQLAIIAVPAVIGFFLGGFSKGLVEVIVLVLGALAGAAIVLGLMSLFQFDGVLLRWTLAVVGGVAGLILIRRARKGDQDWGLIILASLMGSLLVTRGLSILIPSFDDWIKLLFFLALTALGVVFQGGLLNRNKTTS